ncbi:asparagine synthase (glutamine-hydrolyzing) [Sphingopyxis terrae]|nr:asparagine synthase (glutamine-hydrolyzing) [Sphingopyxis terrae subsp. ummariensis]SMQ79492.1 asparagine synthase (glutamine-hydrolysing) [Sphingopyxis terrae subsp. ummariensis]
MAAIEHWGIDAALQRAVGMFALGLWDRQCQKLHLARDRFGEKPLYFGWSGQTFLFASELKAIDAWPNFTREIDRDALALLMRYLAIPAPRSIFKGIFKLEPGCLLTVAGTPPAQPPRTPPRAGTHYETLEIRRWWSLPDRFAAGFNNQFADETEALATLEAGLNEAVALQLQADVPLGVFLSGGIDSSLIAALMQRQSGQRVRSFTVGSEHAEYNEATHARAVADHLGTDHYELFVSDADAKAVIPALPTMYDEPFADSSQIPTHLVSRAARQHVTVALSGDGGDELFGGYNRYLWGSSLWNKASRVPFALRQLMAKSVQRVPGEAWDRLLSGVDARHVGYKVHKVSNAIVGARTFDDFYRHLISEWRTPDLVLRQSGIAAHEDHDVISTLACADPTARMMFADAMLYLPNDILCKVDRAAMAISLETRAPFLDHRVAEIAWRLPMHMRIRRRTGKWALREILYRHVPQTLIERPKAGFGIPIDAWLRGPLREWAEMLLDDRRIRAEGYFNPEQVRAAWTTHLKDGQNLMQRLWPILMFQAWQDHWLGDRAIS